MSRRTGRMRERNAERTGRIGHTRSRGDEVLRWARREVGCRPDDETCQPVLWCRVCLAELKVEQVRHVRRVRRSDRRLGHVCMGCGSAVVPTPF